MRIIIHYFGSRTLWRLPSAAAPCLNRLSQSCSIKSGGCGSEIGFGKFPEMLWIYDYNASSCCRFDNNNNNHRDCMSKFHSSAWHSPRTRQPVLHMAPHHPAPPTWGPKPKEKEEQSTGWGCDERDTWKSYLCLSPDYHGDLTIM